MKNIAVIGAGLAGLTLATQLNKNASVTVFEKSRGIGGRMATRYTDEYEFDHGAQYFTAKSVAFQEFLKPFIDSEVIKDWRPKLVTISKNGIAPRTSKYASYVATPRMNSFAKELAKDINLVGETHIVKIERGHDAWTIIDNKGEQHDSFDFVVSAIPSHQASQLLPASFAKHQDLLKVKMDACFSLMLGFKGPLDIGFDGAFVDNSSIGWISVNSSKPHRPAGYSVIVQSQNTWAEANVDIDKSEVQASLIAEASDLLNQDLTKSIHQVLHRWLYASTKITAEEPFLIDEENNLAAIGDWCIRGRVEAAYESGLALSARLQKFL